MVDKCPKDHLPELNSDFSYTKRGGMWLIAVNIFTSSRLFLQLSLGLVGYFL